MRNFRGNGFCSWKRTMKNESIDVERLLSVASEDSLKFPESSTV